MLPVLDAFLDFRLKEHFRKSLNTEKTVVI